MDTRVRPLKKRGGLEAETKPGQRHALDLSCDKVPRMCPGCMALTGNYKIPFRRDSLKEITSEQGSGKGRQEGVNLRRLDR